MVNGIFMGSPNGSTAKTVRTFAQELFSTKYQLSFSSVMNRAGTASNKELVVGRSRQCDMVLDYRHVSPAAWMLHKRCIGRVKPSSSLVALLVEIEVCTFHEDMGVFASGLSLAPHASAQLTPGRYLRGMRALDSRAENSTSQI